MSEENIVTEKRNKSKDKFKQKKFHPYRKSYHKTGDIKIENQGKSDGQKI